MTEANGPEQRPRRRRIAPALIATVVLWALVAVVAIGVRSSCPVDSGGQAGRCAVTPVYTILHPGPESFNHAFGSLVFVALIILATASSVYLVSRLRSRRST